MDNCIYHSRDLDGLMSAAIVHNYQTSYWEPCKLYPYDYGELLDTRKFKGKTAVMIDVSMPMDRMELLSQSCMEFMWIDHHISAYNDLMAYCKEMDYEVLQRKINDLILCIEVKKMNLIYYFSNKLSGCEITAVIFNKYLGKTAKKVISCLGQYDTWREFEEQKFVSDQDWNSVVLPFQYGMRAKFNDPERISDYIERLNSYDKNNTETHYLVSDIQELGISIIGYQEKLDETNMAMNSFEMDFEFKGKTYKAICLNSTVFSSNVFKSIYYEQYHDIMIAFQYRGKTDKYKFSMYTTKEDVDILGIAKSFGGGGHAKACGFEIRAMDINIQKSVINIFNNKKATADKTVGTLVFDDEFEDEEIIFDPLNEVVGESFIPPVPNEIKGLPPIPPEPVIEKPKIPKGYILKEDESGRFYWIPLFASKKFEQSLALTLGNSKQKDIDNFEKEYGMFRTPGSPSVCPAFLYDKLKDKLAEL